MTCRIKVFWTVMSRCVHGCSDAGRFNTRVSGFDGHLVPGIFAPKFFYCIIFLHCYTSRKTLCLHNCWTSISRFSYQSRYFSFVHRASSSDRSNSNTPPRRWQTIDPLPMQRLPSLGSAISPMYGNLALQQSSSTRFY